jgi:hypothetical protein
MQLFTDPENQPTQYGTVTLEYMQREIAAEREACAKLCDRMASRCNDIRAAALESAADNIRARTT